MSTLALQLYFVLKHNRIMVSEILCILIAFIGLGIIHVMQSSYCIPFIVLGFMIIATAIVGIIAECFYACSDISLPQR
jgi:type III secretory pathway component EscS